ncbi:Ankrd17, partial [Symbiodinium microadriaticum]
MTCCIFFWSMNFLDWSSSQDARAQNWPGIQEVRSATMADNPQTNRDDLFEIVRDGDIAEAKKALASAEMSWRHSALGQNFLFFVAARRRRGCEELAKQCIAMRINLEEVDLNGQTPLFWAAKRGNLVMIKLLLNVGFEVNFRDKARKTALFFAIENGHLDVADCLIERSASTLVRASNGKTPRAMLKEKNHKVRSRFAEWEWASAEGESEPMVGKEEDNVLVEDSR